MTRFAGLEKPFEPDWRGLMDNILRKGTPRRVYHMELYQDNEISDAISARFELTKGLRGDDPDYHRKKYLAVQRFTGFDYVRVGLTGMDMPLIRTAIEDTAELKRRGGRQFMEEHAGPITNWEQFEKYPWPDPNAPQATRELEWWQKHLPDDMCIISQTGHFAEYLCWLMGYETLCYALYDQRDLVGALAEKILALHTAELARLLEFDRVKMIWGSDDMGFKTGTLISPPDMRQFVLSGHRKLAGMAHAAGRPYLLHSCGNLNQIMEDLIEDVKIDAKHSFEDTIEDVRQVKHTYGRRIALLGGIDVDFLCRGEQDAIRRRVRQTLQVCQSGGGYTLGTGNTAANYIPLDNYLAMVDEGRAYGA